MIASVTLRTEPSFVLAAEERPEPLDEVLEALDENCAGNDHFEFYWFPYGPKALTKRNNRLPAGTEPEPLSQGAAVRRVRADGEPRVRRASAGSAGGCRGWCGR